MSLSSRIFSFTCHLKSRTTSNRASPFSSFLLFSLPLTEGSAANEAHTLAIQAFPSALLLAMMTVLRTDPRALFRGSPGTKLGHRLPALAGLKKLVHTKSKTNEPM